MKIHIVMTITFLGLLLGTGMAQAEPNSIAGVHKGENSCDDHDYLDYFNKTSDTEWDEFISEICMDHYVQCQYACIRKLESMLEVPDDEWDDATSDADTCLDECEGKMDNCLP